MTGPLLIRSIPPVLIGLFGLALLYLVILAHTGPDLQLRQPVAADQPSSKPGQQGEGPTYGQLTRSTGRPSQVKASWPQFRGPDRDGIYSDPSVRLATTWPEGGPKVLWSIDVGEGYAGAAVSNGCVYILDYDQAKKADALRCLSLDDGQEVWRYSYPSKVKRNHGMSRTIPAVKDRFVVGLGPKCHVVCCDAADGTFLWGMDLVKDFGATVPQWYAGQCPLIHRDRLILGVGGKDLMMAVALHDGSIIWRTPNPQGWAMTHSSIAFMDLGGLQMYIWCTSGGIVGVDANDGQVLWSYPDWRITIANVPSPLVIGDGRLFVCGDYNSGAMMLRLTRGQGGVLVEPLYRLRPEVFGSPQHTPILYDGHIFGVRPDGQLVCLDLDGKVAWTSGPSYRFGRGPYAIGNGLIYVLDDEGTLTLAQASPDAFSPLSRARVLGGHESWAPMAFAAGRLIIRDLTRMVCLDIRQQ